MLSQQPPPAFLQNAELNLCKKPLFNLSACPPVRPQLESLKHLDGIAAPVEHPQPASHGGESGWQQTGHARETLPNFFLTS